MPPATLTSPARLVQTDFPTANALQSTFGGGLFEGFLTKLNAAGSALVYSTYIGGDTFDSAASVAVDSSGNAYVAGRTTSSNFATVNPIQATFAGGGSDAFIMKFNAAGSALIYSTYLGGGGGNGFDAVFGIADRLGRQRLHHRADHLDGLPHRQRHPGHIRRRHRRRRLRRQD